MAVHKKKIKNRVRKKIQHKYEVELVDKFDDDDFFDDCDICKFTKNMQNKKRKPTVLELKKVFQKSQEKPIGKVKKDKTDFSTKDERKFMEERGFEYIGSAKDFKMPEFMDCTWRRVACDKFECKICGKIKRDRMAHVIKGEDPDDMKNVFEDVGTSLREALIMIKKDAEKRGIDIENIKEDELQKPPEPEEFPLYKKVETWHKSATKLVQHAEKASSAWLLTEAGADLVWYKNTILVKTYRQLCTRWELNREQEYGEFDFNYTKYVLGECFNILKKSLKELFASMQLKEFNILLTKLAKLEKEVMSI